MRYLPHTPDDIKAMLAVVGVNSLDDLFATIPEDCRRKDDLHLPEHLHDISSVFHDLAYWIDQNIEPGPERTVALRKWLEAKDAAVRGVVHPGG